MSLLYVLLIFILIILISFVILFILLFLKNKNNNQPTLKEHLDLNSEKLKETISKIDIIRGELNNESRRSMNWENHIHKLNSNIFHKQESMSHNLEDISTLKKLMFDKKSRGNFGEWQLETILKEVFGDNQKIIQFQKQLPTGLKPDCIIKTPGNSGDIVIDAKFPLENFQKWQSSIDKEIKGRYHKEFLNDCKKRIDETKKYLEPNNNCYFAIMFIPSEFIFSIMSDEESIMKKIYESRIALASPSTIINVLDFLKKIFKEYDFIKHKENHLKLLKEILSELERFEKRWIELEVLLSKTNDKYRDISNTIKKITKKSSKIKEIN